MIPADWLEMLRCPVTRQTLAPATAEELERLNSRVAATAPLEAALVCADGTGGYPVRDGIPVLLADEFVTFS